MTLFEIDQQIADFPFDVDEYGVITNIDEFEALQMAREAKIENVALYIKELKAEREAIKNEIDNLTERMKSKDRKVDGLKSYLQRALDGQKFESAKVKVSYRKSQQVVLAGEFDEWAQEHMPELLTVKTVCTPSKTAIKEALMDGKNVQYATLVENQKIQIK